MRKLVVALSISTLLLALSTTYLAYELHRERAPVPLNTASAPNAAHPVIAAPPATATTAEAVPSPSGGGAENYDNFAMAVTTPVGSDVPAMTREQAKAQAMQQARAFLTSIEDPVMRRAFLNSGKNQLRASYPGLASYLGLDEAAYDSFLEVLATQELTLREKVSRCALEPRCRFPGYDNSINEGMRLEAEALVGSETYRRFETYRDSQEERQSVAMFRGRLGDKDHMSDAQAERLVLALADERKSLDMDRATRVEGLSKFASGNLSFFTGENSESIAAAESLNRRMRDRAAQVLTAGQLVVYDQMQEDAMNSWRSFAAMRAQQDRERPER